MLLQQLGMLLFQCVESVPNETYLFSLVIFQFVQTIPDDTYIFILVMLRLHSRRRASIAAWRHACECRGASMGYQRKPAGYRTAGAHKALRRSPQL